jgi:hypothetical protein
VKPQKKTYKAPQLARLGKLTDLTARVYGLPAIVVH